MHVAIYASFIISESQIRVIRTTPVKHKQSPCRFPPLLTPDCNRLHRSRNISEYVQGCAPFIKTWTGNKDGHHPSLENPDLNILPD